MNIILFKNQTIYKNLFQKDKNKREINIYNFQETSITGINLYYPNCLLHSNNTLYLPLLEKTMSLKQGTIYEKTNMIYEYTNIVEKNTISGNYFFFVYNTDNYFHFLYDTLPYLISYFEIKKTIPDLKLLMQYPNPQKNTHYPFVVEILELLGITDTNIEMIDSNCKYENVFVSTSYTHDFDSNLPPRKEIYNFYQQFATNVLNIYKNSTPKKIYISRRTHLHNDFSNIGTNYTQRRKLVNEDELVDKLVKDDFVEVFTERLSTVEKIAYFANATHVVGCIGGGIANVLFSKPTTRLRAIISPTFLDVNTRFQYSLNCVDVCYDKNTEHIENTEFKKYMRVKTIDHTFIGEIIEVKKESIIMQYTDGSNTGWNSANTFLTKEFKINEVEKLDNGLNSSFLLKYIIPTKFCCHRINTIAELKQIPTDYGIELDLRDNINGDVHISHDPFNQGESFNDFLQHYQHSFIILNIKSERIEWKVLEILKKYNIKNYFFLDSSFPMIHQMISKGENNIALRFSEFEGIDTIRNMKNKVKWVWVDCFTKNPLDLDIYKKLKSMNYKLCFVSPELQSQPEKIDIYKNYFQENEIYFDMICTKYYNIENWK